MSTNKYTINPDSKSFKFMSGIIFIFMAVTMLWPALTGYEPETAQAGQINTTPAYEELQKDGEAKKAEADLKLQQAKKLKELCSLKFEDSELCGSNNYGGLNQELEQPVETPEGELSKTEGLATPTQVATSSNSWQQFIDYAKANPWRGQVFPDGNHLQIAKANMARYESIEGCHPYLLASIHYSETGLQMTNGANGQGAFQAYSSSIRYPANSQVTDFKGQARRACNHIRGKVGGVDLSSLDDVNLIGKALALYNGCYSPGIQAYARGDYGTPNGWDKCPYTANLLLSNEGMLQCAVDGCRRHNKRKIYGTMAFIAHLKTN